MSEFKIIPVLGRKTSVPADDASMFKFIDKEGRIALTHDAGGLNFDLSRKRNACAKSYGYNQYSSAANAQATKCLGLFELYDGTNRNHLYFDNGKFYYLDAALAFVNIDHTTPMTFAKDNVDLYSMIQVGEYIVWADRGETEPYKWKHGDTDLDSGQLIASGTSYEFRYLETFQRRVIGAYSGETNGDIDIRWSTSWPGTAITSLNYPDANQLYIPNDDSITGIRKMGRNRCFIYSENSIHGLVYFADYESPFRILNIIDGQGFVNHHGIVNLGDRHYGYNKNYGFCEFRGGNEFPHGGRPISEDIEANLQDMNTAYLDLIVGTYYPLRREVVWTAPFDGGSTPSHLLFYNIDSKQWRVEDKAMRYVDNWQIYSDFTWADFIAAIGGTGVWSDAGSNTWAYYTAQRRKLVYAPTDGHLYDHTTEALATAALNGYRIEPMLSFGDPKRYDLLAEIWFDIGFSGSFSIDVSWRGGDTAGEVEGESWTSLGSISCDDNARPVLPVNQNQRLHQIKWGTNLADEKFEVNGITFIYKPSSGTV